MMKGGYIKKSEEDLKRGHEERRNRLRTGLDGEGGGSRRWIAGLRSKEREEEK
jgi:hypothetical protein